MSRAMTRVAQPSAAELRGQIRDVVDRADHWRVDAVEPSYEGLQEFLLLEICRFAAESAIQVAQLNESLEELRGSMRWDPFSGKTIAD